MKKKAESRKLSKSLTSSRSKTALPGLRNLIDLPLKNLHTLIVKDQGYKIDNLRFGVPCDQEFCLELIHF